MIQNRDAGAVRSPSPTGPRPMGYPDQTTAGGEGAASMPRVNPAVAAATIAVGALHTALGVTS